MTIHFQTALKKIREKLLAVAEATEEQFVAATLARRTNDMVLARKIVTEDKVLDELEVDLEEECLKTLALHQPFAQDLRFIITALKANNDLERIGDLSANIASRAITLAENPPPGLETLTLIEMEDTCKRMVSDCIKAFIEDSPAIAREVLAADSKVNKAHVRNFRLVEKLAEENPGNFQNYIGALSISRYLERIGDQAKNIAEDVIYLTEGKIVRHNPESLHEG